MSSKGERQRRADDSRSDANSYQAGRKWLARPVGRATGVRRTDGGERRRRARRLRRCRGRERQRLVWGFRRLWSKTEFDDGRFAFAQRQFTYGPPVRVNASGRVVRPGAHRHRVVAGREAYLLIVPDADAVLRGLEKQETGRG